VECLVQWRAYLASAAARAVRAGGNSVEMEACAVWSWGVCVCVFGSMFERGG
jgi:hypothetical protein